MAVQEEDLQGLYNEMNRRGLLKEQGSDLQQISHELRRRGVINDPTQGGLAQPATPAAPAAASSAPAGFPVLPSAAVQGAATLRGPVAHPPGQMAVKQAPAPAVAAPTPVPPPARQMGVKQAGPRPYLPPPLARPVPVPKVAPVNFPTLPAEEAFWNADKLARGTMGATVALPQRKQDVKRTQMQALAGLGGALPQMFQQLQQTKSELDYENQLVTASQAAAQRGELNPQQVQALNRQVQALNMKGDLYNDRAKQVQGYQARYKGMLQSLGDKPLHGGMYYPGEQPPPNLVERGIKAAAGFLAPATAAASQQYEKWKSAMMATGEYPALPPLPPQAKTPEQRADYVRQKNDVITAAGNLGQALHPNGTVDTSHFGWLDLHVPGAVHNSLQAVVNFTPWQRQLLPIIQKQKAADDEAYRRANLGKAALTDYASMAAGWYAGGLGARALGGLLSETATPWVAKALTGAASGAAASSAASGTAALIQTRSVPQALQAAKSAAAPGALLGAGAGLLGEAGAQVFGKVRGAIRNAQSAAEINNALATMRQRAAAPLTQAEIDSLPSKLGSDINHWSDRLTRSKMTIAEINASDDFSRIEEARQAGLDALDAQRRLDSAIRTAKIRARTPGAQPPPEAPAAPTSGAAAPKPAPRPGKGGGGATLTAETAVGPQVTLPGMEDVPLRQTPPAQLSALAGTLAALPRRTPEQQQALDTIQAHLQQHQAYQQQMAGPAPPYEAQKDYTRQWSNPRNPARTQVDVLQKAAQTATTTELQGKLNDAASQVQAQWNQQFRQGYADPNELADQANNVVAPPMASPWRQMTTAEQEQVSPGVRRALLIQDVVNSQQTITPGTPPVFDTRGLGAKSEADLRALADQKFAAAQQAALVRQPAPALLTQGPEPLTQAPQVTAPAPQVTAQPPVPPPQQPMAPAPAVTAPEPTAAPPDAVAPRSAPTAVPTVQGQQYRSKSGGRVVEVVRQEPTVTHVRIVEPSNVKDGRQSGDVVMLPAGVLERAYTPLAPAAPTAALAPEATPAIAPAQRAVGRTGATAERAQQAERKQATEQIGRAGAKKGATTKPGEPMGRLVVHEPSTGRREAISTEQPSEAGGAAGPPAERRQNLEQRKRVAEMTPEERGKALLTDDLTGLGNQRAYRESEKKAWQASIDADSLKYWNDTFGHPVGDAFLRMIGVVLGKVLQGSEIPAYHISGDEFVVQGSDVDAVRAALKQAAELLEQMALVIPQKDGSKRVFTGAGMSYAIAERNEETGQPGDEEYRPAYADADDLLARVKQEREAAGLRAARGEPPPGFAELTTGPTGTAGATHVPAPERRESVRPVLAAGQEHEIELELQQPQPATAEPLGKWYRFSGLTENELKPGQLVLERATGDVYRLVRRRVGAQPYWEATLWEGALSPGYLHREGAQPARADGHSEYDRQEYTIPELLRDFDYAHMLVPPEQRYESAPQPQAQPATGPSPAEEPAPSADLIPGTKPFVQFVRKELMGHRKVAVNNPDLNRIAGEYLGGSMAQGTYDAQDVYDALETGVNRYIQMELGATLAAVPPDQAIGILRDLMTLLPTQTIRTAEKVERQQFSTPPSIAYVAAYALNPQPEDIVLEPSAGTGSLAVMAEALGARTVLANEIAPRRAALLEYLGFPTTSADAERLNSTLPQEIRPTAVIMNPPFSATGGRTKSHKNEYGFRHLEEALKRLQPGGRLVAIMGRGAAMEMAQAKPVWSRIAKEYTIRANVGMPGSEYTKYGTSFDNQLIVVDKTGPAAKGSDILTGQAENLEQLVRWLDESGIRTRTAPAGPVERPAAAPGVPAGAPLPGGGERAGLVPGGGQRRRNQQPARVPAPPVVSGAEEAGAPVAGAEPGTAPPPPGAVQPARSRPRRAVALGPVGEEPPAAPEPASPTAQPEAPLEQRATESAAYVPYVSPLAGKPHPGKIVETASMAAVDPPPVTYQHHLKEETVAPKDPNQGISAMQLQSAVQTGARHAIVLPSGERAGFLLGDGTGSGKGRTVASIIADNWEQGRRRAIWVSVSADLYDQAGDDFDGIGYGGIPLHSARKVSGQEPVSVGDGVIFVTYNGLQSTPKKGSLAGKARWQQLADWLGEDGVVIFDEAHKLSNVGEQVEEGAAKKQGGAFGKKEASGSATVALKLQAVLPKLRVVYSSATAMTDVNDMGYMVRLGLWGRGTSFPGKFAQFESEIGRGGVGAMEQVARDMKAMGMYQARFLSYEDVRYEELVHGLTESDRRVYDAAAAAWRLIEQQMAEAFSSTRTDARKRLKILGDFRATQQSFFKNLITAIKTPSVIERAERDLAAGRSVIISLIGTGEAREKRQIQEAAKEGIPLDDLDFSPREMVVNFVKRSFPVQNFVEVLNPDTGQEEMVPATLPDGSPEINPEALALQEALIGHVTDIYLPENPLDKILFHFGHANVAEMTGRSKRRERVDNQVRLVSRPGSATLAEKKAFQSGKKRVGIISQAASTGVSLHADLREPNHQQRVHILLELPWSADLAMQIFGRSHRTNQASAPIYVLATSDIGGERRFSSTIAKRLSSLGALTRGSRSASGAGGELAKYNYEGEYGTGAVGALYNRILNGGVPAGWTAATTPKDALLAMGVVRQTQGGAEEASNTSVERFLNRVLTVPLEQQNPLFAEFDHLFQQIIAQAKSEGTFDDGLEDVKALAITEIGTPQRLHQDAISGTQTRLHELGIENPTPLVSLGSLPRGTSDEHGFYRNKRSGNLFWAYRTQQSKPNPETGVPEPVFRQQSYKDFTGDTLLASELKERFEPVKEAEGRKEWQGLLDDAPKTETSRSYLVTGTILPIWEELTSTLSGAKVKRMTLAGGKRLVGVEVPPAQLPILKAKLGVGSEELPAEAVWQFVWDRHGLMRTRGGGYLQRRLINGETVVEVYGFPHSVLQGLAARGFPNAILGFKLRVWIPEGNRGLELLRDLLQEYPSVISSDEFGAKGGEVRQSLTSEQQRAGPATETDGAQKVEDLYRRNKGKPLDTSGNSWRAEWERWALAAVRKYRHLPRTPEFAELHLFLARLEKGRDIANQEAMIEMAGIVRGLARDDQDLFNYALVVRDLAAELERQEARVAEGTLGQVRLPEGLTPSDVMKALDNLAVKIVHNDPVLRASAKRAEAMERIKQEYQAAVTAVLGRPPKMDLEDYFHHQVFSHMAGDRPAPRGLAKIKAPTYRGYLKHRVGSTEAYNTDWIEAEHEVLSQMIYDTMVYKLLKYVERWDIKARLKAEAALQNKEGLQPYLEKVAAEMNRKRAPGEELTPEDVFKRKFNWKQAAGFQQMRALARDGALPDTPDMRWDTLIQTLASEEGDLNAAEMKRFFAYANWLLSLQHGHPAAGAASMIFSGIRQKKAAIKNILGEEHVTWEDLIPEGYMKWQPREGSVVYRAWTVPDRLVDQINAEGAASLGLDPSDLARVMALGGRRRELVIPEAVGLTLDNFNSSHQDTLEADAKRLNRKVIGWWKQYQLLNPARLVGYNLRNEIGDIEAILFNGGPGGLKFMKQALADLTAFIRKQPPSPELREWLRRGGMQAVLQAVEQVGSGTGLDLLAQYASTPDALSIEAWRKTRERAAAAQGTLSELSEYRRYVNDVRKRAWNHVWARVRGATDLREAVGRYATYLSYLGQMERSDSGRPNNFGASDPLAVMAITDVRDRAWELSNRLVGAYDEVSELHALIAANWVPFWRWQAVNWSRTVGLVRNVPFEMAMAGGGGAGSVPPGGPPALPGGEYAGELPPWYSPRVAYRMGLRVAKLAGIKLTSAVGVGALVTLGAFALKALWLYSALHAWNRYRWGQAAIDAIPEYDRGRPLLIVDYNPKTGKVVYFTRLGALQDVVNWFGFDNYRGYGEAYANGRMSLAEIAKDMLVVQPTSHVLGALGPAETAWEAILGRQLFPDPLHPRDIRDRAQYLADAFSAGPLYRAVTGKPQKRNLWWQYVGAKVIQVDEATYQEMYGLSRDYLKKIGKGDSGAGGGTAKSDALYNYKHALMMGDTQLEARSLREYVDHGGTREGFATSIHNLAPLAGMRRQEQETFLAGLGPGDQARLWRAYEWLMKLVDPETNLSDYVSEDTEFAEKIKMAERRFTAAAKRAEPLRTLTSEDQAVAEKLRENQRAAARR